MNILHLQLTGNPGGIVSLCRDFANNSTDNNIMYFLFEGGTVADAISREGHQVVIDCTPKKQWVKKACKLERYCKQNGINVIINHANAPIAVFVTDYVIRRNPNIKWIMYFHSAPEDMNKKKRLMYGPFIHYQIKHADARIAISSFVKGSAARIFNVNENTINVVYNGVDSSRFSRKAVEDTDKVNFIYVGRLFPRKGVHILIEAFSYLKDIKEARLILVGRGPQEDELKEQTKKLGLEEKVSFFGLRMDIPDLLLKADYFVHPAIWNEGFGITLVEAMNVGLPCVAFKKGAIPEIIVNEANGYIIDDISAIKLAETIKKCVSIRNSQQYKKMHDSAISTSEKFSIANMVQDLTEIIKGC